MVNSAPQEEFWDIAIIGGGLAGLTSSVILAHAGYEVVLFEKKDYPRHKVCGEYISNEIRPLLESLGLYPDDPKPVNINRFQFSSRSQAPVETKMEMGGFGISRYALDKHLYKKALEAGVQVIVNTEVTAVDFWEETEFRLSTTDKRTYRSRVVVGAQGKRSSLDKGLSRQFMNKTTEYIAVKQHFRAEFPEDLVALHNFEGGYAGLSMVEDQRVNMCYLTSTRVFKKYRDLDDFQTQHLSRNTSLASFLENAEPIFDKPLVISQVNFDPKLAVEAHFLMCGDSAGLIHPLCGNGMAMAIHSAAFCSEFIAAFLDGEITREEMEESYAKAWREVFSARLKFGRYASNLFGVGIFTDLAIRLARNFPRLFRRSLRLSHGAYVHESPSRHA